MGEKFKNTPVFNCVDWEHGFSNVQKVRSKIKVANYISKYITKDLVNSPVRKGKRNTGLVKVYLCLQSNMATKKSKGLI